MYKLQKIDELKDIDSSVALLGTVKLVDYKGKKLKVYDETGEIIVSKVEGHHEKEDVLMIFGVLKLTPRGYVIYSNNTSKISNEIGKNSQIIEEYISKIKNC
ncbi:hypothetical protein [Methanococcus voltae]|uniref:Uncharacterized protein n=2 Tax=Methanococcus voltae TaxID=2188 RepID=A0A8J7S598_METVO|nr:hypothetical protein [Methanococcus voltae]MBP2172810.1 hypothetical protein [Methanococcus voltae]MBP2201780.1 hypothetical protein [Methanococcus voltae]MCS3922604.1 hypothetical protein [Methanococcus voltae PS]